MFKHFLQEATKITLFCIGVTVAFALYGVTQDEILIILNTAVLANAAVFCLNQKTLSTNILAVALVIFSTLVGGVLGYYFPALTQVLIIIYAGLAFYLPKTQDQNSIFITGAVLFLVFASLPFNLQQATLYARDGLIIGVAFVIFRQLIDRKESSVETPPLHKNFHMTAFTAVVSLSLAWMLMEYLSKRYQFSHLYWISLTALVVIQGSHTKTIKRAVIRIIVNALGALVVLLLFHFLPRTFWLYFGMLTVFLFLIFFSGYSFGARSFFLELFVMSFTYLLGAYKDKYAWDRMILTFLGGAIVIVITPLSYVIFHKLLKNEISE